MRTMHLFVILLISGLIGGYVWVLSQPPETKAELPRLISQEENKYHRSTSLDRDYFDPLFVHGATTTYESSPVYAGVVPHHLVAGVQLATFFEKLKKQNPPVVVIVGPNHLERGPNQIVTSLYDWKTPYGKIAPNRKVVQKLVSQKVAVVDESVIDGEWSIAAVTPYIKHTWPNAQIVPIIVKNKTSSTTIDQLAQVLSSNLPIGSLVLSSIDFSHYQPYFIADFHDVLAKNILASGDISRIEKTEIDSQPSMRFLLAYNQLKQAQTWHEVVHTNSAVLADHKADWLETTSHILGYYTAGLPSTERPITLQFFGDMMLDRSVAKVMGAQGLDYLLGKLGGQENRFFTGADLFIANLEGPFAAERVPTTKEIAFRFDPMLAKQLKKYNFDVVNLANNHTLDMGRANVAFTKDILDKAGVAHFGEQYNENIKLTYIAGDDQKLPEKIAFVGLENVGHDFNEQKVLAIIADAKKQTPNVIVYMHWGIEYQRNSSQKQRDLAHKMIDQGAIAVMGAHPHVVQEIEVYKGSPIVYSMGNFIFDQYFSKETQEGLSVGLTLKDNKISELRLFPMYGVKSQVFLMTGKRRDDFLKWMGENSRLDGREIIDGVIKI